MRGVGAGGRLVVEEGAREGGMRSRGLEIGWCRVLRRCSTSLVVHRRASARRGTKGRMWIGGFLAAMTEDPVVEEAYSTGILGRAT